MSEKKEIPGWVVNAAREICDEVGEPQFQWASEIIAKHAPAYSAKDISNLKQENIDMKRKLAIIFDECCFSDSLGVPGSSFSVCRWCGGESSPGQADFKHTPGCLMEDEALEEKVRCLWEEDSYSSEDVERLVAVAGIVDAWLGGEEFIGVRAEPRVGLRNALKPFQKEK